MIAFLKTSYIYNHPETGERKVTRYIQLNNVNAIVQVHPYIDKHKRTNVQTMIEVIGEQVEYDERPLEEIIKALTSYMISTSNGMGYQIAIIE